MCNPSCNYQCPRTTTCDDSFMTSACFRTNCTQVSWSATLIDDLSANPQDFWGQSISRKKTKNKLAHEIFSWIVPSTHDGAALVVPATCPGKQEHFTVCDRSSILFLLQQRCSATTSQVPVRTWCAAGEKKKKWQERWNNQREKGFNPVAVQRLLPSSTRPRCGLGLSPCRIFLSSLCSLLCIPLIRKLPGRADYQFPLNRPFITNASISPSAYAYILCHFVWEALSFLRVDAESLFF